MLDASAILALVNSEPGGEAVQDLIGGAIVSAANWSEILQKSAALGLNLEQVAAGLRGLGVAVVPFGAADAEATARLWPLTRHAGLSLADRACLALAQRLGVPAYTADRAWAPLQIGLEIQLIR